MGRKEGDSPDFRLLWVLVESHQCLKCQLRIALLELGECRAYWHKMVICRQAMTGH